MKTIICYFLLTLSVFSNVSALVPDAPVAATKVSVNGFRANWPGSASDSIYYIDVALDNSFTQIIWNNLEGRNYRTKFIPVNEGGIKYYYRVRAFNSGISDNSWNIERTLHSKN